MTRNLLIIDPDPEFLDRLERDPQTTLSACWAAFDAHGYQITVDYPKTTQDVAILCNSLGYDVTPFVFARMIQSGEFDSPGLFSGALAWRARDIANAIAALHASRRWLPGRYVDEKTDSELARDQKLAAQARQMLEYANTLSTDELELRSKAEGALGDIARIALRMRELEMEST